ncbi:MAG: WD40 repeat domain-containing protein [Myxococcota bacterium]|nr:WD40 repeat domain-containing protein [Myxococcota bacterium]
MTHQPGGMRWAQWLAAGCLGAVIALGLTQFMLPTPVSIDTTANTTPAISSLSSASTARLLTALSVTAAEQNAQPEARFLASAATQYDASPIANGILAAMTVGSSITLASRVGFSECERHSLSVNGAYAACWTADRIRVFDTRSGAEVWSHSDLPEALTILPASQYVVARFPGHTFVASLSQSGRWAREIPAFQSGPYPSSTHAIGWEKSLLIVKPDDGTVQRVTTCISEVAPAISVDEQRILSVCSRTSFGTVDGTEAAIQRFEPALISPASSVVFSPSNQSAFIIDDHGRLSNVDPKNGRRTELTVVRRSNRPQLALSPDGSILAVTDKSIGAALFGSDGRFLASLPRAYGATVAFSTANRIVTAGSMLANWDLPAHFPEHRLRLEPGSTVIAAHMTPDFSRVVAATSKGTIRSHRRDVLTVSTQSPQATGIEVQGTFQTAVFNPAGTSLVVGDRTTDRLSRFDEDGHLTHSIQLPAPRRITWPRNERLVVLTNSPGQIQLVDGATLALEGACGELGWRDLAASPAQQHIVALDRESKVHVMVASHDCPIYRFTSIGARSVAIDDTGQHVAALRPDAVEIWQADGQLQIEHTFAQEALESVAISATGTWVAAASSPGDIIVWKTDRPKVVAWLPGYGRQAHSLQFAASTATLMSAYTDETIRFWNVDVFAESPAERHSRIESASGMTIDLAASALIPP